MTRADAAALSQVVKASRWGQIENGYLMKGGQPVSTTAGAMQLAHMARTVGITSDRLEQTGRRDAAEILREIEHQVQAEPTPYADLSDRYERAIWEIDLPESDRRLLIDLHRKGRRLGQDEARRERPA